MRVPNMRKFKFEDSDKRLHEVRDIGKADKLEPYEINYSDLDEKAKKRFIDALKLTIRGSDEYKQFVRYLKESLDMNECTFFNQINTKKKNIRIEIHHEPFRLTDLINIAITHFLNNGYQVNELALAEFIMSWHYRGLIGLIPLSKTVHELAHSGKIFIPLFYPFGDIARFYSMYKKDMSENQIYQFEQLKKLSLEFDNSTPEVLRKRFVYLKADGFELPEYI